MRAIVYYIKKTKKGAIHTMGLAIARVSN